MSGQDTRGWRSVLFVPGSRPDRFAKALAGGADAVCVDLEDAVAAGHKDQAREAAIRFLLEERSGPGRAVRINSPRSAVGLRDLLAVLDARPSGAIIAIPKVESAEELSWVDQLVAEAGFDLSVIVQVETLRGIENAPAIGGASRRAVAMMFGGLDLAAELGVPATWDALLYGRSRIAHAAAQAGLAAIDMPLVDINDLDGCLSEARRAAGLGFTAKMAIHPKQVPAINDAYTPTDDEVAQAQRIVRALEQAEHGVVLLDGKMVERPIVLGAQRVLARVRSAARTADGTGESPPPA